MIESKPVRILQIVTNLKVGSGVLSVVLGWHRHLDTSKVQFDYLYFDTSLISHEEEILKYGGRCFHLPHPYKHPFQFLYESYKFFKKHKYKTVHSHITHLNLFFFPLAKWFGAENIIQHSHLTVWSNDKINGLRNYVMLHTVWPLITRKMACSQAAGEAYFGKNFTVINNGIDIKKFIYNPSMRDVKRKELGLENNFVICNIGRFSHQKNHVFLVDVFKEIVSRDASARLALIGVGPTEDKIKEQVNSQNLQDKVLFLGVRKDIADLLQAVDVLCMPSLYEGLPVVGVEGQAAGVPGVFADTITPEILLLPSSRMLSLKDSPAIWADTVLSLKKQLRSSGENFLAAKGFDIHQTAKQIQDLYFTLVPDAIRSRK